MLWAFAISNNVCTDNCLSPVSSDLTLLSDLLIVFPNSGCVKLVLSRIILNISFGR